MTTDAKFAIAYVLILWALCGVWAYVDAKARWMRREATRLEDISRGVL